MVKSIQLIIGVSIIFLLLSCASNQMVENKPPSRFEGIVLAKDIDESGTFGVPIDSTNEFNTEDEHVAALLTIDNVSGSHALRWEWIAPDGNVYLATNDYPVKVKKGKYLPKLTAWHQISLKNEPASGLLGNWTVNIFIDDELIGSKSFMLSVYTDPLVPPEGMASKPYPKDWGLIIGIEDYDRLPKVDFARKDAMVVREYFNRILGVPEENIISLIDSDATKARIEGYLKKYIPANIGKDATLYVYFAGHGMPGLEKGEPYLVPYDADTRFIEQTGYKLISFYQDLQRLDVERTYVFLDSCFSGVASRAADMLIEGARPALIHVEDVAPASSSIVSFNATSTGQISNSFPEKGHGLFTYYLLRGLKGEADSNDDGWATVKEIYEYVRSHVTRVSRRLQKEQTPILLPPTDKLKDIGLSRSLFNQ